MNFPLIANVVVFAVLLFALGQTRHKQWSLARKVLVGLAIGVIFGLALQLIYGSDSQVLKDSIQWFNIVGNGYVQLLQMIVMPLVFASILSAVARLHNASQLGKISFLSIGTLLFTTLIAALVGVLVTNMFGLTAEGLVQGSAETARLNAIQSNYVGKVADLSVPQLILSFVPKNPFADLTGANPTSIISIVIFSAFLGVAALKLLKEDVEKGQRVLTAIDTLQGWVITFRDRNEINALTAQLSQVMRYVDNLRIMRHEQLNRMTTLSGLLHMGHYDEAIRYIQAQSEHAQELLDFISSHFHSPTLCGLLLGKATRAREKGVALSFDPACRIDRPLPSLMESELISIIGNLLDNAIEATQRAELPHEPVEVLIQLNARELIIEVADRGVGIRPDIRERIFERGVTTKTRGDHGIGLYLIEHYVTQAGGTIEVADNAPRGTIFTLFIPADAPARPHPEAHDAS